MTTKATLYRDGKMVLQVDTCSNNILYGLYGRVVIIVRDEEDRAIAMSEQLKCQTRGGKADIFTPSSGRNIFFINWPEEIGGHAKALDIYQSEAPHVTLRVLDQGRSIGAAVFRALFA